MSRSPVKPEILPQRQLHGQSVSTLEALVAAEWNWNIFIAESGDPTPAFPKWNSIRLWFYKNTLGYGYLFCFGGISYLKLTYQVFESSWMGTSFIAICYCCSTFCYNQGMEIQFPDDSMSQALWNQKTVVWDLMFSIHDNNFPLENNFQLSKYKSYPFFWFE